MKRSKRGAKRMSFQNRLAAAYGLAVVILFTVGVVSYRNIRSVEETRQWGRHSSQVLHRIEAFHAALEHAEQIAFESSGSADPAAKASFAQFRSQAEGAEKDIRTLTADNFSQQQRLDRFEPQLKRYLDLLDSSLEAPAQLDAQHVHQSGRSTAQAAPPGMSTQRAQLTSAINETFTQMTAEEDRLAAIRRLAIDAGLKRSTYFLIFGFSSAFVLSGICFLILRGEMRKRSAVQRELESAQAGLEVRVEARTQDLRAANQALQSQIEERKRVEAQVQQLNALLEVRVEQRTVELTEAVRELDAFCYTVAHDLRAPLRHIDGFARILENEFQSQLQGDAHRYLSRVVDGVNQMGHLIDDLLELSRIGRKKLSLRSVRTQDMVERIIGNFRVMPEARSVEWRVEPLPDLNCDAALFEVVLTNLISNAVKFTRDSRPRLIQFGTVESDGSHSFFIRDNGVGFDPKYADKLFGVFQRLHRQEDFPGTGIGLATVQRIVQRHGGMIRAEGELGKGATFYFTMGAQSILPARAPEDEVDHVRVVSSGNSAR
jgi:signal transduction histidine kinase